MVAGRGGGDFAPEAVDFLRRVLEEGALLEAERFPLAARILDAFIARKSVQPSDLIVLNGLPRHLQQARAVDQQLTVVRVIQLDCDARTVLERLRRNSGGDRAHRQDDAETLVARKLAIYEERTRPLLNHYRESDAKIISVKIGTETQPADIVAQLGEG